nr:movement protein [Bacopa chlorosis virus]
MKRFEMALVPKKTALTFSADDETSLERSVSDALSQCVDLNMGVRRCAAFPAINKDFILCELTTKETKSVIRKLVDKTRGRLFVNHAVIHLMYIPVILNSTHAVADLKLKNLATGDELYGGTKVSLNEAFILTMSWPRSLFADAVDAHKGLYLGGAISCSSTVPHGAKIGMFYPLWSEQLSDKQLYHKTVAITNTQAIETFTKTMISSDGELRSLLRSRASIDGVAKNFEQPVLGSKRVSLLDVTTAGVDFTVNKVEEITDKLDESADSPRAPTSSDVLITRSSATGVSDLLGEQTNR